MGLAGHLYKLQQLDLELHRKQQELRDLEHQLSDNEALLAAESKLASQKAQLEDLRKTQRSCEWELEDLQEKVKQIGNRLYSGTTRNPKELTNLELELKGFKSQIRPKEDALLASMAQVEEIEGQVRATTDDLARLKRDWDERQRSLGHRKGEVERAIAQLGEDRARLAGQAAPEALDLYQRVRIGKGRSGGEGGARQMPGMSHYRAHQPMAEGQGRRSDPVQQLRQDTLPGVAGAAFPATAQNKRVDGVAEEQ
jgi:predicted  nucleic acid-binding Zn-ribbon protein